MRSYVVSWAVCLGSVALGVALGYPSPAIPNLNAHRNPFHVDPFTQSWIGSIINIGALVSSVCAGPMVDRFGRKLTLMLSTVPSVVGWALVASSVSAVAMETGRFLTGVGIGIWDVGAPIYLAEIAPENVRGLLGSSFELSVNFGVVLVYLLGYFLPWNWLAVVSSAILGATVLLLVAMPESPRWLLMKYRRQEAIDTLVWLRGGSSINAELDEMEESLVEGAREVKLSDFRQKRLYKPTLIIAGLMAFHSFTGIDAILSYSVNIFQDAKVDLDPYLQTVFIGLVGFAGNLLSALVVDRVGRRSLLLLSGSMVTVSLGCLSGYFLLLSAQAPLAQNVLFWIPVSSLVVFHFAFTLAYGPIPFVMMSELVPNKARGVVGGFTVALLYACSFASIKFFVNINLATFDGGAFFVFAASSALSLGFVYFFVPETKGKTLEEIEKYFR